MSNLLHILTGKFQPDPTTHALRFFDNDHSETIQATAHSLDIPLGTEPCAAGERAAEGLREATAKEEAKNESKTGYDLAKGADRFEERAKSSAGRSAQEKQKG
jgi:hypothetical protein